MAVPGPASILQELREETSQLLDEMQAESPEAAVEDIMVARTMFSGFQSLSKYPLPPPPETRPHQEIAAMLDSLETLDIVLFSCPISWYSMQMQGGRWSHVGMVYRRDGVYNTERDSESPDARILILESTMGKEEERHNGVDLIDARTRLHTYFDTHHPEVSKWKKGQYIGFRKLKIERTPELLQAAEQEFNHHKGKPYETNVMELVRALLDDSAFPLPKNHREGPDSLFCSELVAYMYQGAGLLRKPNEGGLLANEYSPCDFSSEFSHKLPLLKGVLEKEVIFGFPPPPPAVETVRPHHHHRSHLHMPKLGSTFHLHGTFHVGHITHKSKKK